MSKSPITSPLSEADKKSTGAVLQATLVDLIDLSLIAKQVALERGRQELPQRAPAAR
jgi:hypothetical protein